MADYLDRILETKRAEVAQLKARKTMNELRAAAEKADPRGRLCALCRQNQCGAARRHRRSKKGKSE